MDYLLTKWSKIYIAVLKFDFFFFLAFTVQFIVVVINTTDLEFYLTIAAIPITIVLLLLAGFWTRKESVVGMIITIVGGLNIAMYLSKLSDQPANRWFTLPHWHISYSSS